MKQTGNWKRERLGLLMIAASLVAIVFLVILLLAHQRDSRESAIRTRGLNLVQLLSGMPVQELLPKDGQRGLLQVFGYGQRSTEIAYAGLVDPAGRVLNGFTAPGVIMPETKIPDEPSSWLAEQPRDADGRSVIEFHAPLLADGRLRGFIRLGYFKPTLKIGYEQLPFIASLALTVFLLTPIFYLLVKREVSPLRAASHQIDVLIRSDTFQKVDLSATGELSDFLQSFNRFTERSLQRIHELESGGDSLQTSNMLLSYKQGRIEAVLQALPEAIIVLDETGAATYANAKVPGLLGIKRDEVVGQLPREWCVEPDLLAYLSRYQHNTNRGYAEPAVVFSHPQAPEKTIAATAYPLFSPHDPSQTSGTLVVFRDVTQEFMAREARGEFVAHVAHELKSPLNVLHLYSDELLEMGSGDEALRIEAVNVIHDEVDRLSTLINNLLSITKIEMGSMSLDRRRVRLRDLLQDAMESVSRNGRDTDLQFTLDLPRELPPVTVDKDLLRVAVNNLLTNAIKYNRPGGKVTLSAAETDEAIEIRVTDSGIGITPEDQAHIFEKFYRSNEEPVLQKPGHGLGLSLAKQIIDLHHGRLNVTSTPGHGTEFTIELSKEEDLVAQVI